MDELQQNRFDDFMNSTFDDKKVRDLIQELLGGKGKLSEEVVQVFRITGKIFCGQLTEEARVVQMEENRHNYRDLTDLGPILPRHLQEARRRLIGQNFMI